jgi:class 3 adenylate cyclase/tetratricopeptide (TPR) repeat protein
MPEERKLVTILFADVTGSTALGEALDPEDVRALMGRYYQHARRVIAEHGGRLEKFIGDAVMAIFGLPQAHGNDPERALAAALALRAALADDALLAGRLLLRIGVNTGEVVATRDASAGDFLVTGDAVNVAARLQQAATPGEILVGERTQAAGVVAFHFGEARAIEVKGKSQPLSVFPVVGPRPTRALSRPPLVGRRRELAQLGLLRDGVLEERHPQLVSIVALAGTGKTRLLEEFLARLDPTEEWKVATARCPPYGQTLTAWPLRGLLDELLGERFSLERVAEVFTTGGHAEADATRLAEYLLAALGVETGEQVQRESIFNAWRLFIEALARQTPLIVVFEDLHWASGSLLDLVEHVTHPRTNAPLLILVLSRPELLDRRPSWGGGRRSFTALALSSLTEAQTRQLIDPLVPELVSPAVRARIVERAGGNPFFAIELAHGLAERLAARADPASVEVGGLPDTVYEAVLARLDQLLEPEREALQVAAVAGRTFRLPTLLAALPERDPSAIATALEGLLAREVVTPVEGEDDAYTFRHILFRDVAYGMLTRAERVRLHVAVAQWLEAFAADRLDEFVELLAYHYREAATLARQAAVPLGVEVDTTRAVHYLVRAGTLASRSGLLAPALDHMRAAIGLAPQDEHLQLYEQLGDCAIGGDAAVEGYQRALALWRERDQSEPLTGARLLRKLLTVYWFFISTSNWSPSEEELAALYAEALWLAEQAADEDEVWRVRLAPLNPLARQGSRDDWERDRDLLAAAVEHFERRQDWPALSLALDEYACCELQLGAYEEAREAEKRRLAWPQLPAWARGDVQNTISLAYFEQGDYDTCITTMQDALAQVRPGDPLLPLTQGVGSATIAAYLSGRWDELEGLQQTLALIWDELQQVPGLYESGLWWGYLAILMAVLAREDRVATDATAALLERVSPPSDRVLPVTRSMIAAYRADDATRFDLDDMAHVWLIADWILLYFVERDLPTPRSLIEAAWKSLRVGNLSQVLAEVAEALASGDTVRLAAAIDTAEAHHLVVHAARMRIVLAQRTGDRAPLERARPVLERLGDRQFLGRLEEVQAALE